MTMTNTLRAATASFPRVSLAHLPTPLERLASASQQLQGIDLFVKRDDQTGLAFGGNKARKLEFIMADAQRQESDSIITWAGIQSNWCRQTAAAARMLEMRAILVLFQQDTAPAAVDGNLLLDRILDADVRVVPADSVGKVMELEGVRSVIDPIVEEEREAGRSPYVAPIGGSMAEGSMTEPWGAVGYVNAVIEIVEQATELGVTFDSIVMATGSGATQAGLLVGVKALSPYTRVIGISVSETTAEMSAMVRAIVDPTIDLLGLDLQIADHEIIVLEDYLAEGYGILNDDVTRALRFVAETQGILLDPVYTGKAMAGLLDLVDRGYIEKDEKVLFLHSGGTPALFPYRDGILARLTQ
jgi:D-cysteine desulfhydrase family pyridoxal phosphate-dependent enzyme